MGLIILNLKLILKDKIEKHETYFEILGLSRIHNCINACGLALNYANLWTIIQN